MADIVSPDIELEIFRTGEHIDSAGNAHAFTAEQLQEIVDSFNPEVHEPPLVKGHPQHDSPAYGLVKGLRVVGDRLKAIVHKVEESFKEEVNAGRYPKISPRLYPPDSPINPTPGKWGLGHVGFVAIPAIKGLAAPQFSQPEGTLDIQFSEDVVIQPEARAEENTMADKPTVDAAQFEELKTQYEKLAAQFSERESQLNGQSEQFAALKHQNEQLKAKVDYYESELEAEKKLRKRQKIEAQIGALVQSGKLRKSDVSFQVAFCEALDDTASIEFGEAQKTPLEAHLEYLNSLPSLVELGEVVVDPVTAEPSGLQLARQKAADAYANAWKGGAE